MLTEPLTEANGAHADAIPPTAADAAGAMAAYERALGELERRREAIAAELVQIDRLLGPLLRRSAAPPARRPSAERTGRRPSVDQGNTRPQAVDHSELLAAVSDSGPEGAAAGVLGDRLGIKPASLRRALARAIADGVIRRTGDRRGTRYFVAGPI